MGLGRFGGGLGAVRYLARQGAIVTVTDLLDAGSLRGSLAQLNGVPVHALNLGGHQEQDFRQADLIVASPAVRPGNSFLQIARQHGIPITTEIGLLLGRHPQRVTAVTGTVGKSTTAALIAAIWQASGRRAWFGGNIGGSLLDVIDDIADEDWLILELSSFQLAMLDDLQWSPEIAVVTNFAPNHLDWHGDLDHYRRSKQAIFRWQQPGHWAIVNGGDESSAWPTVAQRLVFGSDPIAGSNRVDMDGMTARVQLNGQATELHLNSDGKLPGSHNQRNLAAAIGAAAAAGLTVADMEAGLASFTPLPHRLEFLGEHHGRTIYNDSKATTPEAAIAALEAFDRPIVLLAGGSSKGADLSRLAAAIASRAKAVALMGETGPELARLIALAGKDGSLRHHVCGDFEEAVHWAVAQSQPGDVILLSPGCASFGWFRDYEDRGNEFRRRIVNAAFEARRTFDTAGPEGAISR